MTNGEFMWMEQRIKDHMTKLKGSDKNLCCKIQLAVNILVILVIGYLLIFKA